MNSEELEQSLRTEFENYLKDTVSELKQEVSGFQEKIDSAFEKHKSQIDEAFQEFFEKFGEGKDLEESFTESVSEHMKLARDEGSKITAAAFAEAEKLSEDSEDSIDIAPAVEFTDIRDAINDISNQDSQSEILKSLVHHATQFTPRGAFFIVKNEHLVGWRMFGTEEHSNPQVIREVFFPVTSKTALSESVETLATVEGNSDSGEDALLYLNKLNFEQPENMYAIPLVARGRGVAVLYADNGSGDNKVNVEALETLMRVAGLTVEVLASTQMAKTQVSEKPAYVGVQDQTEQFNEDFSQPDFEESEESEEVTFEQTDSPSVEESEEEFVADTSAVEEPSGFEFQPVEESEVEESLSEEDEDEVAYDDSSWEKPSEESVQDFSIEEDDYSTSFDNYDSEVDSVSTVEDYQTGINETYEQTSEFETTQFESFSDTATATEELDEVAETETDSYESSYEFETSGESDFETISDEVEDAETGFGEAFEDDELESSEESTPAPPVRSRFADRNVDLPIEVSEDERRLHNDARRFARLLVSEIKLYNEQKVKEGRESSDLYERLREAIDRSREMYDKRVQPPVAAKFDYFNYELVNTLAEGDEGKLGTSYPGGSV